MSKIKKIIFSILFSFLLSSTIVFPYTCIDKFDIIQINFFKFFIYFIVFNALFVFAPYPLTSKIERNYIFLFSIFIGILSSIGESFSQSITFESMIENNEYFFIFLIKMIIYSYCLNLLINKYFNKTNNYIVTFKSSFIHKEKFCLKIFLFLIICWLPYFIICWPGVLTADANESLVQFFGDSNYSWTIKTIQLIDSNVIINNHQPVCYTLLLGFFAYVGQYFGSLRIGICLYTIFQMIIMALIFTYSFYYLKKNKAPDFFLVIGILFFALCPIVPFYMVTIVKDVLYVGFLMLSTIFLHKIISDDKFNVVSIISCVLAFLILCLLRNNGIYIVIISCIVFLIFLSKKRLLCCKVYIPVICIYLVITNVIYPINKITPGSPREMYSVTFQQISRVIKYHGDDWMSNTEKESVNHVLTLDKVTDLNKYYDPQHADPVKARYNVNTTSKDFKDFINVWIHGLVEYPITYVDSFIMNTYPYYSLNSSSKDFKIYTENKKAGGPSNEYSIEQTRRLKFIRNGLAVIYRKIMDLPIASLITNMGFSAYLLYFGLIYLMINKKYKYLLIYIFVALNYLINFLGPVAYYRYGIPHAFLVPLLLGLSFSLCRKEDKDEDSYKSNI